MGFQEDPSLHSGERVEREKKTYRTDLLLEL
jgi:hypothetical protein